MTGGNMSNWFLVAAIVIYIGATIGFIRERNWGMALAFGSYAISNLGFIWTNLSITK